jgi:hypothetical protein
MRTGNPLKRIRDMAEELYGCLIDEEYIVPDDERDDYWREKFESVLEHLHRAVDAVDPYLDIQVARRAFRELADEMFANNVLERDEPYGRVVQTIQALLDAARFAYE